MLGLSNQSLYEAHISRVVRLGSSPSEAITISNYKAKIIASSHMTGLCAKAMQQRSNYFDRTLTRLAQDSKFSEPVVMDP